MKRVIVLCCALAAGCATTEGYRKMLAMHQGFTELEVVRIWGPPESAYEAGGSRFLTYSQKRSVFVQGQAPSYQTTTSGYTTYTQPVGGSPSYTSNFACTTVFELRGDQVVASQFKGNDCVAPAPRKPR